MIKSLYVFDSSESLPKQRTLITMATSTNAKELLSIEIERTVSQEMRDFLTRVRLGVKKDLKLDEEEEEYIKLQISWYSNYRGVYEIYESQNPKKKELLFLRNPRNVDTFVASINSMP